VRTSGAAALQGEIVVSMRYEVIGHIISSSWEAVSGGGGTCVLYCTSTTSAIFCKLQGRDSDPERHPFCFCSSLYYIHRQSQTGAWFWGFVEPTTEGRMWGIDSYLRWVHIFLLIRKLDYLFVAFLVLQGCDHLHNWWGSVGNTRIHSYGGCKCLRFV